MAFIDTLLTELPDAKVILIDKRAVPGGHWVDAYGFVQLHQPSLLYGVASKQLEGNWFNLMLRKWTLPWNHRASKDENVNYFEAVVNERKSKGQLQFYPNCQYDFDQDIEGNDGNVHHFSSVDGKTNYSVKVGVKLINGVLGECKIPSQCPVEFPVDPSVTIQTPNKLYDDYVNRIKKKQDSGKKYIVLGAGKTGMDTVVYLQRTMRVKPENVYWVISNDVWMISRESGSGPWEWPKALLKHNQDKNKASLDLEAKGGFVRLDKSIQPTKFRFPVIGKDELALLRKVPKENVLRRGRVSSITTDKSTSNVFIGFADGRDPWKMSAPIDDDLVFLHCACPGPFNGNVVDELFISDKELDLYLLFAPPVSISMSTLAYLEASRHKGELDMSFGRKLLLSIDGKLSEGHPDTDQYSENDVLRRLVRAFQLDSKDHNDKSLTAGSIRSLVTLAVFLALAGEDPLIGYEWLKRNRLSFFSIPDFKGEVYETMNLILENNDEATGFSEGEVHMISLLRDKLEPLAGK